MPANTTPIFEVTPFFKGTTFQNADSTSKKTLYTAGTNGSRVDMLAISSDDTTAVNLAIYVSDGTTDHYIGNLNIPAGTGFTTVSRMDGITTLAPSLGYIVLAPSWLLKANTVAVVTSAKTVHAIAMGGDY